MDKHAIQPIAYIPLVNKLDNNPRKNKIKSKIQTKTSLIKSDLSVLKALNKTLH